MRSGPATYDHDRAIGVPGIKFKLTDKVLVSLVGGNILNATLLKIKPAAPIKTMLISTALRDTLTNRLVWPLAHSIGRAIPLAIRCSILAATSSL